MVGYYNKGEGSFSIIIIAIFIFLAQGCSFGPKSFDELVDGQVNMSVNPSGRVPLGALAGFITSEPVKVSLSVGGEIPVEKSFKDYNKIHSIPILGLYADKANPVTLTLTTESGKSFSKVFEVQTKAIPEFLPNALEIEKMDRTKMEEGFHLVEMLVANKGKYHSYTMMFDDNGVIRWYMDMSSTGQITYTALRNKKGNWLYLDWDDIYELDALGRQVNKKKMYEFAGNHHVSEVSDGVLLMGGSRKDAAVMRGDGRAVNTRFDHVLEWDVNSSKPVKYWDLGEHLDIDRLVFNPGYSLDHMVDWFHLNSIAKDSKDGSVIASGRNQGVVKLGADKNLIWIMSPHALWGQAGRRGEGAPTEPYLLTAVDKNGNPLSKEVQYGTESTEDFSWSTGQHSMNILENGNLLVFDNGLSRDFSGAPTFSRAVEYKIDDKNRTIQQVWQYGKERGLSMFSPITSDVDVLPKTGNRLITAGNVRLSDKAPHAKIVEVTYPQNEVVFEASVFFKDANSSGKAVWADFDLAYKGERYSLYGDE